MLRECRQCHKQYEKVVGVSFTYYCSEECRGYGQSGHLRQCVECSCWYKKTREGEKASFTKFCSIECRTNYYEKQRQKRLGIGKTGRTNWNVKDQSSPFSQECQDKFWSKVEKTEGCWLWKGKLTGSGKCRYGHFYPFGGLIINAHRYSYMISNKLTEIPEDKQINHKCNNTQCVRPDHLYLGTQQDNANDMVAAGRQRKRSLPPGTPTWQQRNRDKVNAYMREWYKANRDKVYATSRKWQKAHKDKLNAYARQQYWRRKKQQA